MPKTIQELSELMNQFVNEKGWYQSDSKRPQNSRNIAISLVLEAGEVLEQFQWRDTATDQDALSQELADVALYLLQLASINAIDLEDAILKKLSINYLRDWDGNTVK